MLYSGPEITSLRISHVKSMKIKFWLHSCGKRIIIGERCNEILVGIKSACDAMKFFHYSLKDTHLKLSIEVNLRVTQRFIELRERRLAIEG